MILITFENQCTWEFNDRLTAEIHVSLMKRAGIPVVKIRCDDTSDSSAINNYVELLNLNIQ